MSPAPELYPAIDVLGGKAVRLEQGDFGRSKEYDADPLDAARRWVEQGARRLHLVDLDGAREGRPVNLGQLARIAADVGVPVQYGGGLRTVEAVGEALGAGADRVVVGTTAFTDPDALEAMVQSGGERVWVALDVREGVIATAGWLASTETTAPQAAIALAGRGVRGFVYTSVDRDGTLEGPDVEAVRARARRRRRGAGRLLGRHRVGRRPAAAGLAAARGRDRRQGAVRGPDVRR